MQVFDNVTQLVGDDLKQTIQKGSKISVAAAYFSIYAYEALKEELEKCEELRFIFTSPAFTKEENEKIQKEFYISKLSREKSLYGTEFEIRIRNEMTQKAIARECAEWIRKKAKFKSIKQKTIPEILHVHNSKDHEISYMLSSGGSGFDQTTLGYEKGNMLFSMILKNEDTKTCNELIEQFDQVWHNPRQVEDVTEQIIRHIGTIYQENSPELIYFVILYNIFNEFLEDLSEEFLPNTATGFKETEVWKKLFHFQKDAVIGAINKLEKYNGCVLADSVGLGKTFSALGVIKYYELRNKNVLVLCPKKLADNWLTYCQNRTNNILQADRFRYDVLHHTDLDRESGYSNGLPLDQINWGNYDLLVIDESHNFRNNEAKKDKENRYQRLMRKVIQSGVKTKVLMLSATPVNNRFGDLKNQLALAYEGKPGEMDKKLGTRTSIEEIFRKTQRAFKVWSELPLEERTTSELLSRLDFDFFEVLDSLTIARSRKHIQRYYDASEIGTFPERLKPISLRCDLTHLPESLKYNEIYRELTLLNLGIYAPFKYILPSCREHYEDRYDTVVRSGQGSLSQADREMSLQILMRINLLKRLESSVDSFRITLRKMKEKIENAIELVETYGVQKRNIELDEIRIENINLDDEWDEEEVQFGKRVKVSLKDMDTLRWKEDLLRDKEILQLLIEEMEKINPQEDNKLSELKKIIHNKIANPINAGNNKIMIFSAFADTAEYLYQQLSQDQDLKLRVGKVAGGDQNRNNAGLKNDFIRLLTCFSPQSKSRNLTFPDEKGELDILIGTDCISEGQNLQDCDYLINYDIHWNPVRIIQRFGRIDRIGSTNQAIQLVNFWPNLSLDEYINLKERVESRMIILNMAATGEDNVLSNESSDLAYRREQLCRLQEEVVDLDELNSGVSITDLGLNDFRMDLLSYIEANGKMDHLPFGMHGIVRAKKESGLEPGIIFALKNINPDLQIRSQNRLHPFYLVYIRKDGTVHSHHLEAKAILDTLRGLCKGESVPQEEVVRIFNDRTHEGRDMKECSFLLEKAIGEIIEIKDEADLDSLFSAGGTTILEERIRGLEDFELLAFLVIEDGNTI